MAEFKSDIADAVTIAERYWAAQFRASGQQFRPIRQILPYQREGEISCGGQALPRNNAVYCSQGDFIAYDVNWSVAAFRQVGDAFVFYLLATSTPTASRSGSASVPTSPSSRSCRPTAWPGRTSAARSATAP